MLKWIILSVVLALSLGVVAQTIPKDFKPQETKEQPKLNKHISQKEGQAFNNLSHPLSVTGGGLILTGAAFYIIGSESKERQPITDTFLENYSPSNAMQFIGIGTFVAGAVLFTIFSTDRSVKSPKREKDKKYNPADWEVFEE